MSVLAATGFGYDVRGIAAMNSPSVVLIQQEQMTVPLSRLHG